MVMLKNSSSLGGCFRMYQSGQSTVFSGAYILTVLQSVYTWLAARIAASWAFVLDRLLPTAVETPFLPENLEPRSEGHGKGLRLGISTIGETAGHQ